MPHALTASHPLISQLTREQALDALRSDDLIGLGMVADAMRRALHPEDVISYIIEHNIDYSIHTPESIHDRIREALAFGASCITMQSGTQPEQKIEWFEELLRSIRAAFPSPAFQALTLCCFSSYEIAAIAKNSSLSVDETLARLQHAGLDIIPGGGAEVLDASLRRTIAERPLNFTEWLTVHRSAHLLGMKTLATLLFGKGESHSERIEQLEAIRALQEETGGFVSFTPWHYQPADKSVDEATSVEYLKMLALSRIYLDNIPNIRASWATQGLKVLELALHFGANDAGSALIEDDPRRALGRSGRTTEEDLRRIIRDAGLRPAERDALYCMLFLQ